MEEMIDRENAWSEVLYRKEEMVWPWEAKP